MKNKHHIKLVVDNEDTINEPMQKKIRTNLTMEFTKKDLERMKFKAGLRGTYTKEQIINNYIKTMLNVY